MEEMTDHQLPEMFQLSHDKEIIEAKLAKDIYGFFDGGRPKRELQLLASIILSEMGNEPKNKRCFSNAIEAEPNLSVYNKIGKTKDSFKKWGNRFRILNLDLNITEVADIIRLAGTWVEKRGGRIAKEKETYRSGVDGIDKRKFWKEPGKIGERIAMLKLQGAPALKDEPFARFRTKKYAWRLEPQLVENMRNPDPRTFSGMGGVIIKEIKNGKSEDKYKTGKRLVSGSNISIINRLFGLTWGCDISGTTCDEIFALDEWGKKFLGEEYTMLPLGAIVHNCHHTILEVALPLSIDKRIDYKIGFYETLIPKKGLPRDLTGIKSAIRLANDRMKGKHMLRYYKNMRPVGCFRFEPNETRYLKQNTDFFKATRWLKLVSNKEISVYPKREEVLKSIEKYANIVS
jgi:hypothetical protein